MKKEKEQNALLLRSMARLAERACDVQRRLSRAESMLDHYTDSCGGWYDIDEAAVERPRWAATLHEIICEIALDLLPHARRLLVRANGMHGTRGRDDMLMFVRCTLAMVWGPSHPAAPGRLRDMMCVMCRPDGGDVLETLSAEITPEEIEEWYVGYRNIIDHLDDGRFEERGGHEEEIPYGDDGFTAED